MTALDQAFVRAYAQQGWSSGTALADDVQPVASPADYLAGSIGEAAVLVGPTLETVVAAQPEASSGQDHWSIAPAKTPRLGEKPAVFMDIAKFLGPRGWRPMLQVDHFLWPKVIRDLDQRTGSELGKLYDAMLAIVRQGRTVIGFGGCAAGEGSTTLLMVAARGLVQRGLRTVVIDASFPAPQLAQRLGLAPQVGWADVLTRRVPLDEVTVESVADRLAVVPLQHPFAGTGGLEVETRIADSIRTLATHYEAVLIDLGPLDDRDVAGGSLARGLGRRLNTVVLVQDVRNTTPNRLAEVEQCLAAAGVHQSGVVQNFVAG